MYQQIMVPLDGSRFAESALSVALSISRRAGASVHLVTVMEPLPSFAYDDWEHAAEEWGRTYLENTRERVVPLAGGDVTVGLLSGHVADLLGQEVERRSVDLVVMATHGRGALSRAWLGSVANAFLHRAGRPVLLVRPEEGEARDPATDVSFRRMLIPLDGFALSESMIDPAVEFGGLFDAAYRLVRVVPYPIQFNSPYLPNAVQINEEYTDSARKSAEEYLVRHADPLQARGLRVDTAAVVVAQPIQGIVAEVEDGDCDLIAMATHARTGMTRMLLGSTADKVVRTSRVPVLLFPAPEAD